MDHFAGLDVSVKETSICIVDDTGSHACALELGLELCPAEVGPVLRLAYKDQPLSGWLIIAMNVITVSVGGLACSGWSTTTEGFGSPPATGIRSPSGAPTNTSSSCGQLVLRLSIPR
jgi:hypothetical protein